MPSRRDFVRTVLVSSGLVFTSWKDLFAFQAANPAIDVQHLHPETGHKYLRDGAPLVGPRTMSRMVDVAVIGGGPAGLAAAWRLRKARREVLILENEPLAGGTLHAPVPYYHQLPCALGATYFYVFAGAHRELYDDIGAHTIETDEDALFLDDEHVYGDWWNIEILPNLPFSAADKEAFRAFGTTLRTMRVPPFPLASATAEDLAYDAMSARAYMKRYGSEMLTDVIDLYCRSVLGSSIDDVNAYCLLNFYSSEFGQSYDLPCQTFVGGLSEIALKAAAWLGQESIIGNATVVRVRNAEASGVEIDYIDAQTGEHRGVLAQKAIVAMPKRVAAHVVDGLPPDQQTAMRAVNYAPYVTMALCCKGPLFRARAFDFWFPDKTHLFTDIVDTTAAEDRASGNGGRREGDFVYMLSAQVPAAQRADLADPVKMTAFAQRVVDSLRERVPAARDVLEEVKVLGWGHSLVVPTVNSYHTLAPIVARPVGNILFAGADNELAPSVDAAFQSGFDAAERAAQL